MGDLIAGTLIVIEARKNLNRDGDENKPESVKRFSAYLLQMDLTLIYHQFCPDLAIIYHTPYEVMRVSAIFMWKKFVTITCH